MSDNPYKEKIRKLLALANDSGATPEEAANAAAMAATLALKYSIDMSALNERQRIEANYQFTASHVKCSARDRHACLILTSAVAALYSCQNFTTWRRPFNYMSFAGQPHNIEMADSWLQYLWRSAERGAREYMRTRLYETASARYKADGSFRMMFCVEVAQRLAEKLQAMRQQGVQDEKGSTSTALVVVNRLDAEKRAVQEWVKQNMSVGKGAASKKKQLDNHAAHAGAAAGRAVGLEDQIAGTKPPQREMVA